MPKGYEVQRIDVKDEDRARAAVPKASRLIVLDERGREYGTEQFAKLLQTPSAFLIGGADGLSADSKAAAAVTMRLSAMTLPHAIAQLVLLEQMYRGATLLTGHPYHRR
jgi:23S rRNA (pseudouridine1915-N3)-methyltransferase